MMKTKIEQQALSNAIHANASYLLKILHPIGRFTYTENLNPNVEVNTKDYNITRHAGTLYSLLMYASFAKDESIYPKVFKSLDYLFNEYFSPVHPAKNIKAVLQEPLCSDHRKKSIVKLGANGLTLVATSILATRYPTMKFRNKIEDLFDFISFMQHASGQFRSKYDINQADYLNWESLYYPGEACLGLAFAYHLEKKDKYLSAAVNGLKFLAQERKNSHKIPADHWALIASSVLIKILQSQAGDKQDIEILYHHALQIIHSLIKEHSGHPIDEIEKKGWNMSYATCQTATRMEGLIAMYPLIRDKELKEYLKETISLSIQFLMNAQVHEGTYQGAIPKISCYPLDLNILCSLGPDATELRIDYNQHVLSAWISYAKLIAPHY